MSWELDIKSAETLLESSRLPPSEKIISLIKRINPTRLQVSESDREHGYRIKDRLQNLLLENYGEAFHLVPHPLSPDIILIKHSTLPSIDACHADLGALSAKALEAVGDPAPDRGEAPAQKAAKAGSKKTGGRISPKEILRNAELLLAEYEYPQAEEMLASLRIADAKDLPTLVKAAGRLVEEMGAYQSAIELLLAQPRQLLKDKTLREILALTYYRNGMIPEARALFDAAHPGELGKESLGAFADISFRDGNLAKAHHLVRLSEEREGFATGYADLKKEIEGALLEEASPYQAQAEAAFANGELAVAESLLQKALCIYPGFTKARQLAGEIEAGRNRAVVEGLWARFDNAETPAQRLDLLARLLEQDPSSLEKIKQLMASERSRQLRETSEERLETLAALAIREEWGGCFDVLLWFSRQGDEESQRKAFQVAPFFSVLHRNKRLQRLDDQEAKELWLRFVRLKLLVREGRTEGCWDLAQELKPYFDGYPIFREEYDRLLEQERDAARGEIERLWERLNEVSSEEGAVTEARKLVAQIRKRSAVLAAEEMASHREAAEAALQAVELDIEDDYRLDDYRNALLLGNSTKAAELREANRNWPDLYFTEIDDEVALKFAIVAEPMTLAVPPAVDLATECEPSLRKLAASDRHLIFTESEEALVVVNTVRQTATRYRSPNFKSLAVMDFLPEEDVFLFVDTDTSNTMWRAVLSDSVSRFTAAININEHFVYQPGAGMEGLYLSRSKENCYYAFFREEQCLRGVKQSIGLTDCTVSSFTLAGQALNVYRLSYQPDRFVMTTEGATAVLESNLAPLRGCSRMATGHELEALGINPRGSRIYVAADERVCVLNEKLYAVKQYPPSRTICHLTFQGATNVCVAKDTLYGHLDGIGFFYNMQRDKFSQKFSKARFAYTETPSRWYFWDFDATTDVFFLKDITDEVDTLLEWQVLLPPGEDEAEVHRFIERLNDPDFFSIIKPAAG